MAIDIIRLEKPDLPYDLLFEADESREAIEDYTSRGMCYAAVADGRAIGISVLIRTRPFTMELVNLAVDAEWRNKGVGRQLVENAIAVTKEHNCHTLEVGTGDAGIGQLAFYQKCGFRMTHLDIDFFRRHYTEKIVENGIECRHMVRMSMDI